MVNYDILARRQIKTQLWMMKTQLRISSYLQSHAIKAICAPEFVNMANTASIFSDAGPCIKLIS
jgi:hypothetical protein